MSRSVLRRFDQQFFRNRAANDLTQVPAVGSFVDLYRQGATTSEAKSVVSTIVVTPVNVYDPGDLRSGDLVQVGYLGSQLVVADAPSPTQVRLLLPAGSGAVSVPLGARLIPMERRPGMDDEPLGHEGPSQVMLGATGAKPGYITYPQYTTKGAGLPRLDYILSGGGLSAPRLYLDALAGMSPSPSWLNARDFGDLYDAIDALPEVGGVLYMPGKVYEVEMRDGHGLVIDKHGVTLIGDGPLLTIIRAKGASPEQNPGFDLLTIEQDRVACQLRGIQFDGAATALGTNACIVLNGQTTGDHPVSGCLFEDLIVANASRYGLLLKLAVEFRAFNCLFQGNRQAGARVQDGGTTTRFFRCGFKGNGGTGIVEAAGGGMEINSAQASLIACSFEDNIGGVGVTDRGCALDIRTISNHVEVLGCYFASTHPTQFFEQFIYCEGGRAAIVSGCWFDGCKSPVPNIQVKRAARFVNSWGARFTGNVAIHLASSGAMVQFDAPGLEPLSDAVEYGNREWDYANTAPVVPPRITISLDGAGNPVRVFSLSRGVAQICRYANETALPNPTVSPGDRIPLGSMVWLDAVQGAGSKLRVLALSPGRTWRSVDLT